MKTHWLNAWVQGKVLRERTPLVARELDQIHGYLEAVSPLLYRKAESDKICSLRCPHGLLAFPIKLGIPQVALLLPMNGRVL